jgi:hypothetical protein
MFSVVMEKWNEYKMVFAKRWTAIFVSCAVVMTQGSLLKLFSVKHLLTAGKTGLLGALLIIAGMIVAKEKADDHYVKAAMVGAGATVADYAVHAPHFYGESIVTGLLSMALAWCISKGMAKVCQCP